MRKQREDMMVNGPRSDAPGCLQIAFLTALIYNPAALAIWFLYLYPLSPQCYAGPFCNFERFPGVLQLVLVLFSIVLTWLIAWGLIRIGTSLGVGNGLQERIRSWIAFRELRGALAATGAVLLVLLVVAIAAGRASLPVAVFGLLTCTLMFSSAVAGIQAGQVTPQPVPRVTTPFGAPQQPQAQTIPQGPAESVGAAGADGAGPDSATTPPDFT